MFKRMLVALIAIAAIAFTIYYLMRSPEAAPVPAPAPTPTPTAPAPAPTPEPVVTTTPSVPEFPVTSTPPVLETPTPTPPTTSYNLPRIDETWRTYTNRALSFEFQWPTKGKYAPTWEVTFSDKNVLDDYVANEAGRKALDVNGVQFYRVSIDDQAMSQLRMTDKYVTQNGSKYIVITFEKQVVKGAVMGSPTCSAEWSLNSKACIPFDPDEYRAHLDQIVGTFKYTD